MPKRGYKQTEEHKKKKANIYGVKGQKLGPMSFEHKRKMALAHMGNKSGFWRGGVTPINLKIRHSFEYKLWREAVFKRDNYQCIWGGKEHGNKLNADHIKPFSQYPELRFAIDNGRTLCENCHKKTDTYGHKATKLLLI